MAKATSTSVRPWRNAYLHFADGKRVEIVQAHPAWGNDAISRELGRLWKALSPSERVVWTNLAAYDRARYLAETQVASAPSLLDMDLQSFLLTSSSSTTGLDDAFSALDAQPTSPVVASLKHKHPNRAFFYFWRAQKAAVQAAHPTLLPQSLGKEMGRRWRALSRDEKQPWIALAAAEDAAAETLPKDARAPKTPKHAFQLFLEHRRSSQRHLSYNALTKESAVLWRAMSSAEKADFTRLAELERARYEAEMRRYVPMSKGVKKRASTPPRTAKKANQKRTKYPKSAFVYYELENRRRYQDRPYNEYMVAIAKEWRELPETAKATWRAMARDDVRRYEAQQAESDAGATTPETMSLNGASPRETLPGPLPTATSGFALFVHAKKHELLAMEPHLTHNDVVHKASKLWRLLSPNEKEPWRNLVKTPAKKVELTTLDQLNLMEGLWDDEAHPGDDSIDMLDEETLAGLAKGL
ncbi:hypothetical protein SPRG_13697 [Saprolegnia parasitica CBS 223.65]|uniref:HMG box domain-containing protein n=1 Tax=Saprolegnia parasitica (strain CBS 223.65) TaxID=695850 RepID=A0A067BS90_SAPPC|nr:hypothetical protein SPRG_13697 [Saprolegnia parasitica CBS 223.65]KDO21384.1 hypothetical protein SPRG_13697 [Saprolegnia parasitica CBS 223.65]|eukprot:XP_012207939.1 hypothetical protein SPRG_13697 [Saprolegnia parasitica CBS 223.65]